MDFGVSALVVAANQHRTAARRARGVDLRRVDQADLVAEQLDRAARSAGAARGELAIGQQRAGLRLHGDFAPFFAVDRNRRSGAEVDVVAGGEHDAAAVAGEAAGFQHARIVDHAARHGLGAGSGQQDGAAVGADCLIVGDQRVDRVGADVEANQPVTGKIEPDAFAGAHGDRSLRRADGAVVGDARRDEGQIATGRGSDLPLVGDAAAVAAEDVIAGQEIGVADIQGGGDQSADIDARAAAEQDAVGVDEEDLAVGGRTGLRCARRWGRRRG